MNAPQASFCMIGAMNTYPCGFFGSPAAVALTATMATPRAEKGEPQALGARRKL